MIYEDTPFEDFSETYAIQQGTNPLVDVTLVGVRTRVQGDGNGRFSYEVHCREVYSGSERIGTWEAVAGWIIITVGPGIHDRILLRDAVGSQPGDSGTGKMEGVTGVTWLRA